VSLHNLKGWSGSLSLSLLSEIILRNSPFFFPCGLFVLPSPSPLSGQKGAIFSPADSRSDAIPFFFFLKTYRTPSLEPWWNLPCSFPDRQQFLPFGSPIKDLPFPREGNYFLLLRNFLSFAGFEELGSFPSGGCPSPPFP